MECCNIIVKKLKNKRLKYQESNAKFQRSLKIMNKNKTKQNKA